MKKIDQTRLYYPNSDEPPGNCFQACVASILECSISDIPDEAKHWSPGASPYRTWRLFWDDFCIWLQGRSIGYIECEITAAFDARSVLGVPFIASGPSPRDKNIDHSVVMCYERTDERTVSPVMVHDPHPSRDGLAGEIRTFGFFVTKGAEL